MQPDLSVIISSHNSREDFLQRTLDGLRAQTLCMEAWELLLIDNASAQPLVARSESGGRRSEGGDERAAVGGQPKRSEAGLPSDQRSEVREVDLSWHPNGLLLRDEGGTLTGARLRGMREAKGRLLVFVDDDNVLEPGYLAEVVRLAEENPRLGCFGAGIIAPEFEVEPSPELLPYTHMLALRTVDTAQWNNTPGDAIAPWGAGLVIRREVASEYARRAETSPLVKRLDRIGNNLFSGGDVEFSRVACDMGYGKGIFPSLKLLHLMPRKRLSKEYLLASAEGHAYSWIVAKKLRGEAIDGFQDYPSLGKVLGAVFSLSVSKFFFEGKRWWDDRTMPALAKEFERAGRAGVGKAFEFLKGTAADPNR